MVLTHSGRTPVEKDIPMAAVRDSALRPGEGHRQLRATPQVCSSDDWANQKIGDYL
jgi:hypothetical protein